MNGTVTIRAKLGAEPQGPQDQLAAMDQDNIGIMVLYPTFGLGIGKVHKPERRHGARAGVQRLAAPLLSDQSRSPEVRSRASAPRPIPGRQRSCTGQLHSWTRSG